MQDGPIICPYCRASNSDGASKCVECGTIFPWSAEIAKLHDELKSRETNRIRAAATLVSEIFSAAQGGKPVSMAAVMGFVTSWLFPRAMIVLGSIAGALLLGIQTYILWNQTTLLSLQTRAAQIEQAAKLRERVAANAVLVTALKRLSQAYSATLSVSTCMSSECKNSLVWPTLAGLAEDSPVILPEGELKSSWLDASRQLHSLAAAAGAIVKNPEVELEKRSNLSIVNDLIRPATTQCLYDASKTTKLISRANAMALLTKNGMWVEAPLKDTKQYLDFAERFPQTKTNTQMGLLNYREAILSLPSVRSDASNSSVDGRETYRFENFLVDGAEVQKQLVSLINDLVSTCETLARQDTEALRVMEQVRP
jgi:hypothetical protein